MKWKFHLLFLFAAALMVFQACKTLTYDKNPTATYPKGVYRVMDPPSMQKGDPEEGFRYLIYGDPVGNGIPYEMNRRFFGSVEDTVLRRKGKNATVPFFNNVFTNEDGVEVVSGNCFSCHASELNGKIVLGLGDSFADYRKNYNFRFKVLNAAMRLYHGKNSPEWKSYEEMNEWFNVVTQSVVMNNPGTNPAYRLEEAAIAFRHPEDLTYKEDPNFMLAGPPMGTDVPALWHVQKKKSLYYNGSGRGDFTKLLMQVTLLGVPDSAQARKIQEHFYDVFAWMNTIEPPAYPASIDQSLAAKGKMLFADNCAKCHGTYGEEETYPNKIIPIKEIGTDSVFAQYAMRSKLNDWYNESWLGQSEPKAQLLPSYGYMAPPLDGIWATAPYLHNGSVPTVADLLDSKNRPTYWERSGESDDYDYEKLGWNYQERSNGRGKYTFDTTENGAGNHGHTYGDEFTQEERLAVVEYLKTL